MCVQDFRCASGTCGCAQHVPGAPEVLDTHFPSDTFQGQIIIIDNTSLNYKNYEVEKHELLPITLQACITLFDT